jgi:hypothetical protein
MQEKEFGKFYWGFIFIMLSFRIQGVDILPDIVGYILFAIGFSSLSTRSDYFKTAGNYNIPMIILSLFSIYQAPAQAQNVASGGGILLSFLLGAATMILNLFIAYNLFMGIREMEKQRKQDALALEATQRWDQFKMLQIASMCAFIVMLIPGINLIYLIILIVASIVILIRILGFLSRCDEDMNKIVL